MLNETQKHTQKNEDLHFTIYIGHLRIHVA